MTTTPQIPAGSESEIAFISGVTSGAKVAATSFATWNDDTPATYSTSSTMVKWGSNVLSTSGTSGGVTYAFDSASNWTTAEKTALQAGLALWSAEANINFSQATNASSANFTFTRGHDGSAYQTFPSLTPTSVGSTHSGTPSSSGADISIDTSVSGFGPVGDTFAKYGGYPYQTLVHEIGHMLGLGHGGAYNGDVNEATQQFSAYDTRLWSIMSYIDPWTTSSKYYSSYPVGGTSWGTNAQGYYYEATTPMILDVSAIQRIYGQATSGPLVSGGQTFGFNCNIEGAIKPFFDFTVNTHPVITIWDAGVHNTLDLSGFSAGATISLAPGTFTSSNGEVNNIGIAEGTVIETAIGGAGNDKFIGFAGNHNYFGGAGTDTVSYGTTSASCLLESYGNTLAALSNSLNVHDRLNGIETIQFTDKAVATTSANVFDPNEYLASYTDLIHAFGDNPQAGFDHYVNAGYSEGRSLNLFDPWEYLASYSDLIQAFGTDTNAATHHYVGWGYNEGRATNLFDPWEYLASYSDLIRAFGTNTTAATHHYVGWGYNEGRATSIFNAEQYLANYTDLQAAFGDDPLAAEHHYVGWGFNEGRSGTSAPGSTIGTFVGNANANTMVVGAGDTMIGAGGADTFVFKQALNGAATINDFTHGSDVLQISAAGFGHGLSAGAGATVVTASDLASASHAGTSGYFIFDNAGANAGTVYWDANGGSGSDAVALAHLQNVTSLLPSDFHVV